MSILGKSRCAQRPSNSCAHVYCAFVLKKFWLHFENTSSRVPKRPHPHEFEYWPSPTLARTRSTQQQWNTRPQLSSCESSNRGAQDMAQWHLRLGTNSKVKLMLSMSVSEFIYQTGPLVLQPRASKWRRSYPAENDACVCHSGKKFKQCCLKSLWVKIIKLLLMSMRRKNCAEELQ